MSVKKGTLIGVLMAIGFMTNIVMAQHVDIRIGLGRPRYGYAEPRRPPCPGPDYVWVEGRWVWDNYYRRDVWVEGYWYLQPREYYCAYDCHYSHEHRYNNNREYEHGRGRGRRGDGDRDDYRRNNRHH
jgi:WXXGXW repeat (2 copies)